jgi:HAD superfamily hydrolase (TIGR01509 family)
MIKGVLFDMDGVLVDSEEYIRKAAIMMFAEYGIKAKPADFRPFVGMGENKYVGGVAQKYGLNVNIDIIKARTYAIYEAITRGKLNPLPGAKEFIRKCIDKGLKIALASSADRIKIEINLRETGIHISLFHAIVNGLDVERKKPFPDIYLKACGMMGLNAGECLVVEDAISGVEAAKRAGCKCLALTTSFKKEDLQKADWISKSLLEAPDEVINW